MAANSEAAASPLSLLLFSFLDPLVWKAQSLAHLDTDMHLPPLALGDSTRVLAEEVRHALPSNPGASTSLLRGLICIFSSSIIVQSVVLVLEVCIFPLFPLLSWLILTYFLGTRPLRTSSHRSE
jgi:hypothetical protein